jgi:hypothetical protein
MDLGANLRYGADVGTRYILALLLNGACQARVRLDAGRHDRARGVDRRHEDTYGAAPALLPKAATRSRPQPSSRSHLSSIRQRPRVLRCNHGLL